MKKLLVVLIVLAVVAAAVAYFISDYSNLTGSSSDPVSFTLAVPSYGELHDVVGGTGVVQPQETLVISTQLGGQVMKILVDFNDVVESGNELVMLDDRLSQAKKQEALKQIELARQAIEAAETDLKKATAAREQAQGAYDDITKLSPGAVSVGNIRAVKQQLDIAGYAVEFAEHQIKMVSIKLQSAEEALKVAQLNVDLGTIRVPYVRRPSGSRPSSRDVGTVVTDNPLPTDQKRKYVVLDRKVSLNQMVGPPSLTHLFTLVGDLEKVDLQVMINESDIGKVRPGEKVYFTVSAYAEQETLFTGEVVETRLLPTAAQGAVYYPALVTAKNQPDGHGGWLLRPGMTTAGVDIVSESSKDVWVIPNTALDFQLDPSFLTSTAKAILANPKGSGWVAVWAMVNKEPKPIWVKPKFSGKVIDDKTGAMKPEPYTLVEWDPDLNPQPVAGDAKTYPELIIGAPPVKKSGFLGPGIQNVVKF